MERSFKSIFALFVSFVVDIFPLKIDGWHLLCEGKGTAWEGGIRVPAIMHWPGKIPAGTTSDELACTVDILPTVASMIGAELPKHKIDGHNILAMMTGPENTVSPYDTMPCYYAQGELQAIRDRQWKLIFPHTYRTLDGKPGGTDGVPAQYGSKTTTELELYDLKSDRSELRNVVSEHPEIVARLSAAAEAWRNDLGDKLTKKTGIGTRPCGTLATTDAMLKW